ncbi:hypothetical protein MXD63_14425 [Frankia sp. Cpl3]|nr:hypothetical protein [Frankia sp. Cpl3]
MAYRTIRSQRRTPPPRINLPLVDSIDQAVIVEVLTQAGRRTEDLSRRILTAPAGARGPLRRELEAPQAALISLGQDASERVAGLASVREAKSRVARDFDPAFYDTFLADLAYEG